MGIKIKSVQVNRYNYFIKGIGAEEVEMEGNKFQLTEYDMNGNEIHEINYTPTGEIQDKTESVFDEKNRLVEEKYFDEGDILVEHKTFTYENDKIAKEFLHYLDGSKDIVDYKYNDAGFLIEKITMDEDGYEERKEVFEKDDKDRLTGYKIYEEDKLVKDDKLIRNENGDITESVVSDPHTGEILRSKHIYENGKRTGSKRYNPEGTLVEKYEYRFDGDNMSIMIHETPGEKNVTQFEYDDKGNLIKQEEYNKENLLLNSNERKYDEHGNLVEAHSYLNMQGQGMDRDYVLKYEYEYY